MKPFLKWPGSKRRLAPHIVGHFPLLKAQNTYFEPFVGGGAVFFHLKGIYPNLHVHLSDANQRLAYAYRGVRDRVDEVITSLAVHETCNRAEGIVHFDRVRKAPADLVLKHCATAAAWIIYLSKTSFNGLYRENKRGEFNVPYGYYDSPLICDAPGLRQASLALQTANIAHGDFEPQLLSAREGDLVYLDPPYIPISTTSSFTAYTNGGFKDADQVRLRDCVLKLIERGVSVAVSNSNADRVRELYNSSAFRFVELTTSRPIAASAASRGPVKELLILGNC